MKNLFTLAVLVFSFRLASAQCSSSIWSSSFQDGTPINAGDSVIIYTLSSGTASTTDSVLIGSDILLGSGIGAYEPTDGKYWVWSKRLSCTDYLKIPTKSVQGIGDGVREIKVAVPKNYPTGLFIVEMVAGASPITSSTGNVVSSVSAVLNPLEEKNKNIEFDFYNQSGFFISHCKFSDLAPGFYVSNGCKFIKEY